MSSLVDRDLATVWHPCSQMTDYKDFPPYEVVRAQGSFLELADGHRAFDAISSWWCKAFGHCHPHLGEALRAQSQQFEQVILANTTNELTVRFSERLLSAANGHPITSWSAGCEPGRRPGWFGKVFFADNGSTAVEIGMKMALQAQQQRGHTRRTRFAALDGGYHGETIATLSAGDCGLYGDPYRPLMFDVPKLDPLPLRAGPHADDWQDASDTWPQIESQLAPLADELAGIIYEPIMQGAGGMRLYSPDLLRRLRRWADDHDVLLIADEIAAGMGRLGTMLASHHADPSEVAPAAGDHRGCLPDFAIVSKGLTGGTLPLSAVLIPDHLYESFLGDYFSMKAFLHSNTYTGNALAIAVADAALDLFAEPGFLADVHAKGATCREQIAAAIADRPWLTNLRECGLLLAVDIKDRHGDQLDRRQRTGLQVFKEAIRRGAWYRPLGDTMYLMPPLTSTPAELAEACDVLVASVDAVVAA